MRAMGLHTLLSDPALLAFLLGTHVPQLLCRDQHDLRVSTRHPGHMVLGEGGWRWRGSQRVKATPVT